MVAFIDAHREVHGVESICMLLPIAPSTYFRHKAEQRDPTKRSARAQRDDELRVIILRIWNENHQVYGHPAILAEPPRSNRLRYAGVECGIPARHPARDRLPERLSMFTASRRRTTW